jgi:hypothetical protein
LKSSEKTCEPPLVTLIHVKYFEENLLGEIYDPCRLKAHLIRREKLSAEAGQEAAEELPDLY